MRKDMYKKRSDGKLCVTCATPLETECTKKKCGECVKCAREYNTNIRDDKCAEQ